MARRRLVRVGGLLLLAALVVALLLPDVRWPLWGALRHEPFYNGKPASYWCAELRGYRIMFCANCPETPFEPRPPDEGCGSQAVRWLYWRVFKKRPDPRPTAAILHGDPAALPVLEALLQDDDHVTRELAILGMVYIGPPARSAVPKLLIALHDEDPCIRWDARYALLRVDAKAAEAAGIARDEFGALDDPAP